MTVKIGYIIGSLSKNSLNRHLAQAVASLAGELELTDTLEMTEIPLKDLPMYNYDLDGNPPAAFTEFKQQIRDMDGIIIFTPEYNRSFPGVLKNALDIASRPMTETPLAGKPVAVIGASVGQLGTALAQKALIQVLNFLNAKVMNQPEAYLVLRPGQLTEENKIADDKLHEILSAWLKAFLQTIKN